jgi:hypothetical protein
MRLGSRRRMGRGAKQTRSMTLLWRRPGFLQVFRDGARTVKKGNAQQGRRRDEATGPRGIQGSRKKARFRAEAGLLLLDVFNMGRAIRQGTSKAVQRCRSLSKKSQG